MHQRDVERADGWSSFENGRSSTLSFLPMYKGTEGRLERSGEECSISLEARGLEGVDKRLLHNVAHVGPATYMSQKLTCTCALRKRNETIGILKLVTRCVMPR